MECQRKLLSIMVSGIFVGIAGVYAPNAMAGYEVVADPNTPYVYQISAAPKRVIDVREERVVGATANTIHHGMVNMEMAMIPVAGNKGIDMLSGLRGIVPESQGWRVFALKGVNVRKKIDWSGSDSWIVTLDGVLLKNKLIADINWDAREITLAPMYNKTYATKLATQTKEKSILRLVTVRQQFETPEPLIALRLQPAQSAITEARSLPVATVDVPVRTLAEVGENRGVANIGVKMSDGTIDSVINQRVEQATREKMSQLEALEAQYREKLEQLNARSKQLNPELHDENQVQPAPKPAVQHIDFRHSASNKTGMMQADFRYSGSDIGGYRKVKMAWGVSDGGGSASMTKVAFGDVEANKPFPQDTVAAMPSVNSGNVVSVPVQAEVEVTEAPQTKWEVSLNDKTLRNALMRMAARNGYSLSYQTKDQEIKMAGTFYGTFDAALREIEIATGKRIRQVESRLLGRLIIVTD